MGVTERAVPTPALAVPEETSVAALDLPEVVRFLRTQSAWLCRGLDEATDRIELDVVLAAHECSHGRWLHLVATVAATLGADAAQTVASLYAYHGRVVGMLERRTDHLLDPETAATVRRLFSERLAALTDVAVEALQAAADDG